MAKLSGTGVALVTPFNKEGKVDYYSLETIVDNCIEGKVDYLLALGTTAETVTLSAEEQEAVVDCILTKTAKRVPVILGMGGNSTIDVVEKIRAYKRFEDIEAILSVTPYYNKPSQKGLFYHYKTIAERCPVPVIMYNVPGRTGVNMTAETTVKLATEVENIIAVKEASGNVAQVADVINNKPEDFLVLSGDDALTLPLMALGADGVISVVANAFPADFAKMVNYCRTGEYDKARYIHYELIDIIKALFTEGNPAGVKAALEVMETADNFLRLPLTPVSEPHYEKIKALVEAYI